MLQSALRILHRCFKSWRQLWLRRSSRYWAFAMGMILTLVISQAVTELAIAQSPAPTSKTPPPSAKSPSNKPKPAPSPTGKSPQKSPAAKPPQSKGSPGDSQNPGPGKKLRALPTKPPGEEPPSFESFVRDARKIEGLFTLYRDDKKNKLFLEVFPEQLNRNYLTTMTLESAIGQRGLYSGLPVGEFLFNFRRVNNTVQMVIPNTYVRAEPGNPIARSIDRSFSDSPIESLKILAEQKERKSLLVELNGVFLGDLPGLKPIVSDILGSLYNTDPNRTYFGTIKNFPQNLELESIYGYVGDGSSTIPSFLSTLPDSRAFEMRVRYSLSALPEKNGYRPRLADDRIGYFITAFQQFGRDIPRQPFVRYINRWNLEKADSTASISPPVKPITYWLENTIPVDYREAIRDGVLMWNLAFEKIGFKDAIEVKQMPDNADWDPADVRYNTIRWFNSVDAAFAMGPSRTNPLTGEILDADIIVDANFIRSLKQEFRSLIETNQERNLPLLGAVLGDRNACQMTPAIGKDFKKIQPKSVTKLRFSNHGLNLQDICYGMTGMQNFATGQMSLSVLQNALPSDAIQKDYIQSFLRELMAHEVGHTLGLRHNFQGSTMLKPEELNNTALTRQRGMGASVMDYNAVNLAPPGVTQGEYYSSRIGPYDEWAIAYGYSTASTPQAELETLSKIASRSAEPELAYSTDEDLFPGLNPRVQAFDLSSDLLTYAQSQFDNARVIWGRLDQRLPLQGESFNDLRLAFNAVFGYYFGYANQLSDYIGGQYFNRSRYGDAVGRLPFEAVSLSDQRRALDLIRRNIFDEKAFQFSPELLNKLAPSRWNHWGTAPSVFKLDYPVLDRLLVLQTNALLNLTDYDRLTRLSEGELKNPTQTLPIPELFDTLQSSIWSEVLNPSGDRIKVSAVRRNLQRQHMNLLIAIALRNYDAPEDAQTVARYEIKQLRESLTRGLKKVDSKDIYTLAHLEETRDRLTKAIDAPLVGN